MKSQAYENKLIDILKLKQFQKMKKARKNAKEFCLKEERINTVSEELNERVKIKKRFLKLVSHQLPRLAGLAKVHKENITVRNILSFPGSPYNKVADYS